MGNRRLQLYAPIGSNLGRTRNKVMPSPRQPLKIYMGSTVRRWANEASEVGADLVVVSPYLTSQTAERILLQKRNRGSGAPTVLTTFTAEVFATGASKLPTLRRLLSGGCRLFHIDNLHAKILLTPDFVSIGSQNLTQGGTRNKEASVAIKDIAAIAEVRKGIGRWQSDAHPIDLAMIQLMERHVMPLRKRMSQIRKDFQHADVRIAAALLRPRVESVLRQRQWLSRGEKIPRWLAEDFIKATAWWLRHPTGGVRAPRHARRIYLCRRYGWSVDFGANTFLVGKALERCREKILGFFGRIRDGDVAKRSEVEQSLRYEVARSVANSRGEEYWPHYPDNGRDLVFGTQSIDLEDAVEFVINYSGIKEFLAPG